MNNRQVTLRKLENVVDRVVVVAAAVVGDDTIGLVVAAAALPGGVRE